MSREANLRAVHHRRMQERVRELRFRNMHVTLSPVTGERAVQLVGVTPQGRRAFFAKLDLRTLDRSPEVTRGMLAGLASGRAGFREMWGRDVPDPVKEDVRQTAAGLLRDHLGEGRGLDRRRPFMRVVRPW